MTKMDDILDINSYTLTSSTEVGGVVRSILEIASTSSLIHISSYIHNTVLVQNLKLELEKKLPDSKLVMMNHKDKTHTSVVVYNIDRKVQKQDISDEVLKELQLRDIAITEDLRNCKKQLLSKYFTDHLTSFPNLYQLRKDLHDNEKFGLITIAIDNFVTINNFYGFMVGDYIIEQVGNYLIENINEKIYRVSGTEFTLYLEDNLGFYDLKDYMTNLYEKIKNVSVTYQENEISVSLTMASCVNSSQDNLFSKVSMALKYAKDNRLPFWIYEDRMRFENEYEKNLNISNIVRHAVQNSKIVPYFQPIMDNKTSKINKYECLARLLDENNNVISPSLFIPIAKRIKVYNEVTKIIIEKSFKLFEANDYEFSINLSMEDIVNSEMFNFILQKLKLSSASNRVIFEIVESEAIQDFEKIARFIKEIKRYGARIAIDDFGDGYSNFSYLIKMNVDFLKIDGSLIKDIDTDRNAYLVVETIVDFASKLGVETIAEFVHSSTVMDKVKEMGIKYSQGYHIDKPSINIE
ncbi:diguanylate cyclase/phosphodiesterase (GGDEF & EAL domains) [Sulfurimonas gotlandica GD1]|uniref:Diguanylate cyclase/phosphodiesterase (GGDEF & EAL domains) n=1 Tax=Sulfurimonas gotlandica (strain DSM 19862 / JCM 16533 / GD1) TaxID=929558 RepID=B6BJY5_SULGG|nr:GGDEF domain-containing protein [Sulfurimonas gotlandica]EDZ62603.1 ggdef family protein [Sulfurimonas gotlandica GD1]EHP31388.1 diguanylate cyclase/phosphodiesterase (GGDEF & EAL domains) [Sulfurimonas gotlandica GD1]